MKHELAGRYAVRPRDIPWAGWKSILKRAFKTISSTDMSLRCAGVAFYSFLSIFPVLACFVLVYGLVADGGKLQDQMASMEEFLPEAVQAVVYERLDALLSQPQVGLGIGLIVSFAVALWSGSRGTNALVATISRIYRETDDRGFLASAALSLSLTLGALVFLTASLLAIAAVPIAVNLLPLPSWMETAALWVRWPLLAILVYAAILILFRLAPDREDAKWRWISLGAAVSAVLWLALSSLFSFYVKEFGNYSATFGSLSVAVILMLWIYYSTMIVSLGAALNAEIEHQTKVDTTTGPNAPMGERGAYVADNLPEQSSA
ncbi:YihY/virulence factor BrkB family protein [Ahrensia sp. R2A130]|uniref:YihY/virulence factor BrkB family protein n=1 Tax=Ahrensia sp. R2A130 TaxID=744979 RepID=UPI0001E0A495|nr:YihY/virulence factor BrkB family protein [Ahrensia sp. R2A130]EFL88628.1 ribonuclease BN [Ahrensia sp. R2A130]